jgi:hypothetical protein
MTGGPHLSLTESGKRTYPFGFARVGRGPPPDLGQIGCSFRFSFLSYSFLKFKIFCNFCIKASNPVKPVSIFF